MSDPTGPSGPVFHGPSRAPAKRDAAPASAGRPPAPSIKPRRRAHRGYPPVVQGSGPCPGFGQRAPAGDKSASIAGGKARSVIFPQSTSHNPLGCRQALDPRASRGIHHQLAHRLTHNLSGKRARRQRLMRIGTAPALEQITKISGASVQAGWGIPSFTPGGRRSIRAQPPHPFRGPRYRQAENSPLLCPAAAQRSAPPPSRLGTSVQAG